jgi:hypothetical protein
MMVHNVLRISATEEQTRYRNAVADILRNIQNETKKTPREISDAIDISLGTLNNAINKKNDLNPLFLTRLGEWFGAHFLDPWARIMGARLVSIEAEGEVDLIPTLANLINLIATARSAGGGAVESLRAQLNYLPELRRALHEIEAQITYIENRKARA